MKYVNFDRTKTELQAMTYGNSDTIYFTTDTNLIVINHKIYGETDVTDIINKYDIQIKTWCEDIFEQKLYVDLGLPSGLLWATCNIGASKPEDYGDYFAWGETTTKSTYNWSTYKHCNGSSKSLTKYNTSSSYGTVDNKTLLELSDDAARVNWGAWRMPTDADWAELRMQCTWTWTTRNGVDGYKVTGPNGNSIFLPAAGCRLGSSLNNAGSYGYYWSSSLDTRSYHARVVAFCSVMMYLNEYRYYGLSVRPVCELAPTLDNTKTKEEVVNSIDGVCYFTTDTHEIYINGESYGGTSLEGYATEEFVTSQGYLTEVPENVITEETLLLKNYITQTLVLDYVNESLADYITADDLNDLGFLTEVPSEYVTDGELEEMGYATEDWVQGKGYLTEHQDISNLATKEEIPSLEGYALKDWTHQSFAKKYHEHVDLGLPSGLMWATTNIGAEKPEESGQYFSWGELETKESYRESNYKWFDSEGKLTKYNIDSSIGTVDNKTQLDQEDDVASLMWSNGWRIPTDEEQAELLENCNWELVTQNGVEGYKVSSKINDNYIFLPMVGYRAFDSLDSYNTHGYYLSSVIIQTENSKQFYGLSLSTTNKEFTGLFRWYGSVIRPVISADDIYKLDIIDLEDSTGLREMWSAKQDIITDLDTIRSGASKGETSLLVESEIITNMRTLILDISKLKTSIGFSDDVTVTFTGTNNLDECTTLIEAILKLDSLITTLTT